MSRRVIADEPTIAGLIAYARRLDRALTTNERSQVFVTQMETAVLAGELDLPTPWLEALSWAVREETP